MSGAKREEPRVDAVGAGSRCYGLPAVKTLSREYRDTPEPEESDQVPPPEPPGPVRRVIDRLDRALGHGDRADR